MLAALQVLTALVRSGKPLSEIGNVFTPVPQTLINVRYSDVNPLEDPKVKAVITAQKRRLGKNGRLVIRKSGTEPLIRVMTEAMNRDKMLSAAEAVADAVRSAG